MFNQYTKQAIKILKKLITIRSYNVEEEESADFMNELLSIQGYKVHRKNNNVWI